MCPPTTDLAEMCPPTTSESRDLMDGVLGDHGRDRNSEATSDANSEATLKTTTEGGPRKVETLSDLLGKRPGLTMGLECTFWR